MSHVDKDNASMRVRNECREQGSGKMCAAVDSTLTVKTAPALKLIRDEMMCHADSEGE